jgi:hypothetical protein
MIREKKIYCGKNYLEVDIYPYTKSQVESRRRKRGKKVKVSAPKQKNLNDKNARRYLTQLSNANFTASDLHVTCTYTDKTLPESIEEGEQTITKYLRRVAYHRKKNGLGPLKYILVTEYTTPKESEKPKRMHHHIIMNGGMSRDEVEELWKVGRKGERIGRINADRLQPDENGLAALANYLSKEPHRKKRWSSSRNLERPVQAPPNDHKYSKRQVEKIAKGMIDPDYFRKKYPGWDITDKVYGIQVTYNEQSGYYVYLKLRKDTS